MNKLNVILNNLSNLIKQCEQSELSTFSYQDSMFSIQFSKKMAKADSSIKTVLHTNENTINEHVFEDARTEMHKVEITNILQDENNEKENIITITSPFVGTVEFSNQIKLGNSEIYINKGDVICSIEAMKIYNDIKSPVTGTIVDILVKDCSLVEYEQSIINIRIDKDE